MKRVLFALFGLLLSMPAFAAALPEGYTELQYIESDGTQYIDTGIKLDSTDKVHIVATPGEITGEKSRYFFGVFDSTYGFGYNYNYRGATYPVWANSSSTNISDFTTQANTQYDIEMSSAGVYVNGTLKASVSGTFTGDKTAYLLWANGTSQNPFIGKLHQAQIWKNNTLVLDLVPVKKTVGGTTVYGMYNVLDNNPETAFYGNKGDGEFIAGPVSCGNGGTLREYASATGTGAQVGVPTPEHPVEPTFYHQGRMILRAVGDYKDSYDATTGKITRWVGVKVLNGTEGWALQSTNDYNIANFNLTLTDMRYGNPLPGYTSHFAYQTSVIASTKTEGFMLVNNYIYLRVNANTATTTSALKTWLKGQYDAGTPVVVYYPLANSVEEDWSETSYCESPIKVATKDYVTGNHGFGPIATTLNTVIATIEGIVSSTVTQATSISTLATQKQTRPDDDYTDDNNAENCPDYKQCLLVEGTDGKPHWYPIDDPFRDFAAPIVGTNTAPTSTTNASGYTQLEYVTFDGTSSTGAYVDTGLKFYTDVPNNKIRLVGDAKVYQGSDWQVLVGDLGAESAYVGTNLSNYIYYGIGFNDTSTNVTNPYQRSEYDLDAVAGTYKVKNKITNQTIVNISGIQPVLKTAAIPIFLGGFQYSGGIRPARAHMDLYSVQIYNDGTLIFDGVPCRRNSDNQIGIYDKVGRNFRTTPNGINALTPGPEVLAQDPAIPGMSWTATWAGGNGVTAGTVNGEARCTSVSGADYTATNPTKFSDLTAANQTAWNTPFNSTTFSNYNKCWCKIDGVTPTSGNDISPMGATEWVYAGIPGNNTAEACATSCSNRCKDKFIPATYPGFVKVLFGL